MAKKATTKKAEEQAETPVKPSSVNEFRIHELSVTNVKRVKAVSISPDEHFNVIAGKNAQGKTSVLDAIMMALSGGKSLPEKPVTHGEEKAEIIVDLGDRIVRRWWTSPEKSYLELTLKAGGKISNAQSVLDAIVGDLAFDPLAFTLLKSDEQRKLIREISGLDTSDLDAEYKKKYDERTVHNVEGKNLKSVVEGLEVPDVKEPTFNRIDIENQMSQIDRDNEKISEASNMVSQYRNKKNDLVSGIEAKKNKIKDLEIEIKQASLQIEKLDESIESLIPEATKQKKDKSELISQISEIAKYESVKAQIINKKNIQDKLDAARIKWKECDDRLKAIEEEKIIRTKSCAMPVEGLTLDENGVLFNGIPFDQLSTSQQTRISMYIAMSLNPSLKVAIIRNGSLLDSAALKEVEAIAKERDYQIFLEKVAELPDGQSIFIEDGLLKE